LLMISSYFREIKYNMKVLSQKAKCDPSDPGGHISENPRPLHTPSSDCVYDLKEKEKERKKSLKNFSSVF